MRVILFILILAVAALLIALATGFLSLHLTRAAKAPDISASGAKGGQPPTFDIETGSVAVGTKRKNIAMPVVKVVPPGQQSNTVNNAG